MMTIAMPSKNNMSQCYNDFFTISVPFVFDFNSKEECLNKVHKEMIKLKYSLVPFINNILVSLMT